MRCTYVSMSFGASMLTTVFTLLMSSPRAATSVATRMWISPPRKRFSTSMRVCWSWSPWTPSTLKPEPLSRSTSSSTRARWFTNTITSPSSTNAGILASSHPNLALSSSMISTIWLMSSLAPPTRPTVMRTGSTSASRASRSTRWGIVAEKSIVCRSGRICPMIERTCGSKPMSNMRSASSNTRYVARRQVQAFIFSRSIMRPGVHTATSEPPFRCLNCSCLLRPPKAATVRRP
mmetsp:Transcript_30827/g.77844  ORF Transcript_30827/g.77844 Transcript_30827/m.77844 type:complete len:234 (-) Transcript_30827:167-868(-)